jgi:hypothetical protein
MFDEAAVKAAYDRARKNVEAMGAKRPGDVQIVHDLALLVVQAMPTLCEHAIQQAAMREVVAGLLTGKAMNTDDLYSADLSKIWVMKQALYMALEIVQNVQD